MSQETWQVEQRGAHPISGALDDARTREALAHVRHELGTPLTAISVSLDLVLSGRGSLSPERQREILLRVRQSVSYLERLIADFTSSGTVAPQVAATPRRAGSARQRATASRLDMLNCIRDALPVVEPALQRRGQSVNIVAPEGSVWAVAEHRLVERVLVNLLTNASKYSVAGDVIDLELRTLDRSVLVCVVDHGPGIPLDEQPHVFERGFRGKAALAGSSEGSGIGLYLVRETVETLGGKLGVESVPGRGAAFWFSLPRAPRLRALIEPSPALVEPSPALVVNAEAVAAA